MADKSKHSKETVVNGVSLEEVKKQLLAKSKASWRNVNEGNFRYV